MAAVARGAGGAGRKNTRFASKVAVLAFLTGLNDETYYSQIVRSAPRLYRGCGAGRTDYGVRHFKMADHCADPYSLTDAQDWLSSLRLKGGLCLGDHP